MQVVRAQWNCAVREMKTIMVRRDSITMHQKVQIHQLMYHRASSECSVVCVVVQEGVCACSFVHSV